MSEKGNELVEAILDLTRVTIALNGSFGTKAEAMRRLLELSIPPARVAVILAVPPGDVFSLIAKDKKKKQTKEVPNG